MAIQDNTDYTLKGKQVKKIVQEIKESGAAFKPFPDSVVTDGTTEQFMASILALGEPVGTAFLGTVSLSDLPAGLTQEEVAVYVYSDYVVYCDVKSTDVAPYEWWCASYNYGGWRPVNTDTTYSAGTGLELAGTTFAVDNTIATKSEIPTVNNATLTVQKNSASVGTFTANSATDTTINITVPVTAADVSALPASTKYAANLSLTIDSSTYVVTGQLKDQDGNNLGSAQTIDLPLESVVVSGSYDSTNKKIILTLQSGQTIDIPVGDLVSGLQSEITAQSKLSADLVDDSTTTNKFVTATDKTTWSGKQNALTAGSNITISGDTISATDTTYSDFVGATSGAAGSAGLVPAPASGDTDKYLKSDGSWATVSSYTLPAATANTLGGVKIGANLSMDGNDVLSATDTTYSNFVGTDGTAAGTAGLVPAPATTDAGKVLSASGAWTGLPDGIKTLTTADYNYPTNNPTSVALWLLDPGVYKIGGGVSYKIHSGDSSTVPSNDTNSVMIMGTSFSAQAVRYILVSERFHSYIYRVNISNGSLAAQTSLGVEAGSNDAILLNRVVSNSSSETSEYKIPTCNSVSAKISAVIKTNAGAPTTSTTGTKGQLLEDTTNGNLYICTNSASPYAWKQIDKDEILTNAGAPTTSTAGTLGQLLTDTTNAKLYQLTAIDTTDPQNPSYTWSEVGGSSGPTVVQTTGTSTTDVMSQNAVTGMVYADPANARLIKIGYNTSVGSSATSEVTVIGAGAATTQRRTLCLGPGTYTIGENAICISANDTGGSLGGVKAGTIMIGGSHFNQTGTDSVIIGTGTHNTSADSAVMLGAYASATANGAVAIGANATSSVAGQVSIGSSSTSTGYNNSNYRLLSGLYDPQSAHDAATKGYCDTKATITMTTTDPGEGAVTAANTLTAVYS